MHDRIHQARISIVTAHKVSEGLSRDPVFRLRGRNVCPRERFIRNRLIDAIHAQCIVRTRSAKPVPVRWIARDVDAASGVHQPALSIHGEPQAERVGVSVPGAAHPLRAGVHDHRLRVRLRIREHVKSAVGKCDRTRRRGRLRFRESFHGLIPKQPDRFLGQPRRGKFPVSTSPRPAPVGPSSAPSDCGADSITARHHRRRSLRPARPARALPPHPAFVRAPRHTRAELPFHSAPPATAHIRRSRAHKRGNAATARSKRHPDAPAAPPRAARSATRIPSSAPPPAFADTTCPERTARPLLPADAYSEKNK